MKKKTRGKKSFGRQLVSGCVYVALSAVIVAVSVNTAISLLPGTEPVRTPESSLEDLNLDLPEANVIPVLPEISLPDSYDYTKSPPETSPDDETPVSDTASGVDALVIEKENGASSEIAAENTVSEPLPLSVPEDADLGFDGFIKPVDGYVTVAHSVDMPVYSPTMFDYRTHMGVDVSGDVGESVRAVNGGVITEIYNDDLLGYTVCVKNSSGYIMKYSNLLPTLSDGIEIGALIETGKIIGGIGESAISESAEGSHLHIEIYNETGEPVDPEELIEF